MPDALTPAERAKLDASDDARFYAHPRFVQHVDGGFRTRLTGLYHERLTDGMRVLDLMSSWVSHLPEERAFAHVEGHGMSAEELARNPRLDHFFVQNLNESAALPLESASFDAALCTVSVQYLERPAAVFAEVRRVLKPGGVSIVSFSNRMFFQKAIRAWREASGTERAALVRRYFAAAGGFSAPKTIAAERARPPLLSGRPSSDPFYAVLARREA